MAPGVVALLVVETGALVVGTAVGYDKAPPLLAAAGTSFTVEEAVCAVEGGASTRTPE